jgi:hypothetical protein
MRRFFSDDSYWNQPIGPDASTDPKSDRMIELMDERQGAVYINCLDYTIPVYEADSSTPLRTVHQRGPEPDATGKSRERQSRYSQHPDFGPEIPIPDGAAPDPARDGHMAVVDWQSGRAWDMWHVRIRDDGEYESATGMTYGLDTDGVWRTEDFPIRNGESMHFYGPSRAAGVPAIAGLIMYDEIREGCIEHKLGFASNNVFQQFVWPAAWPDGGRADGPLEGCVLQLDPQLDLDEFGLSPAAATIARALQEYGAVNVDGAGGNVLYAEGQYGHDGRSWEDLLDPDDLRCIPMRHYRILEVGETVNKGDRHHRRF